MKLFCFIFFSIMIFIGCTEDEEVHEIINGQYFGSFQRALSWSDNDTAEITITFSLNTWHGSSNKYHYPALCEGTYLIVGNTIVFENDCIWTADFDGSLILSGKYKIEKLGNNLEFYREYKSTLGTCTDVYKLSKNKNNRRHAATRHVLLPIGTGCRAFCNSKI